MPADERGRLHNGQGLAPVEPAREPDQGETDSIGGRARFDVALRGVLEVLKESGHEADTIVLFMSDHGMSFPFSKATAYYNGTWSPVILKSPGMPAAAVHEELVSSVDIMPTLLDLLGVKHPDGLDGRSWVQLINGEKQADRDYVITHVNTVSSGMSLPQRLHLFL